MSRHETGPSTLTYESPDEPESGIDLESFGAGLEGVGDTTEAYNNGAYDTTETDSVNKPEEVPPRSRDSLLAEIADVQQLTPTPFNAWRLHDLQNELSALDSAEVAEDSGEKDKTPESPSELVEAATDRVQQAQTPDNTPGSYNMGEFEKSFNDSAYTPESLGKASPASLEAIDAAARGETHETRDPHEIAKDTLRSDGRVAAAKALEGSKLIAEGAALGAQAVIAKGRQVWGNTRERVKQYRIDREDRARTAKVKHDRETVTAFQNELRRLDQVRSDDPDGFNAKAKGLNKDHAKVIDLAKRVKIDQAHEEALKMNGQYDKAYKDQKEWINAANERKDPKWMETPKNFNSAQKSASERANREEIEKSHLEAIKENENFDKETRERLAKEDEAYGVKVDEVSKWLKERYGSLHGKNLDLAAISNELRSAFPSSESHLQDAVFDAFNAFGGKKTKQAARAARIAKGSAFLKESRKKAWDAGRNSEIYQRTASVGKISGRAIARFAKGTASIAKRSFGAARAGGSAMRTAWQESKPTAPTSESTPVTNE